jgi:hypothetical protein
MAPAPGFVSRRRMRNPGHRARIIVVAPGSTLQLWAEAQSRSSPQLRVQVMRQFCSLALLLIVAMPLSSQDPPDYRSRTIYFLLTDRFHPHQPYNPYEVSTSGLWARTSALCVNPQTAAISPEEVNCSRLFRRSLRICSNSHWVP